ncbi:MAG: helix-hairpin-helix domain-containing protein [Bacteroidales bacterium]|nr:helix-hairpin-helix domain-containing protein [Bacteroidales bacterium]
MNYSIKEYFTFRKGDRNALLIILLLIILIILIPYIYKIFFYKEEILDFREFREDITAFELSLKKQEQTRLRRDTSTFNFNDIDGSVIKSKLKPFPFNPNNLPTEDWLRMGLSERQVQGIKNYEAHGGRFLVKTDFKKIYSISEEEYEILEPFIDLPVSRPAFTNERFGQERNGTVTMVDINGADTNQFKSLRGIGSKLSSRIVNYREKLGGFLSKEQILEVYGIDTSLFKSIEPYITIETSNLKKIDINMATLNELSAHPYISRNVALSIVNMRRIHGSYNGVADILKSELIDDSLFYKISPYLKIETE